jgi:hypothetical protein
MSRVLLFAALASGCYRPDVESCLYACAAGVNRCPNGLMCDVAANRCVQPGDNCDGVGDDADNDDAGNPTNFYTIQWADPVQLTSTADLNRAEFSPVLDEARHHFVFSRPAEVCTTVAECTASGKLVHYLWNDGNPTPATALPTLDATQPQAQLDQAAMIVPGIYTNAGTNVTFIYGHRDAATMQLQVKRINLTPDLTSVTDPGGVLAGFPGGVAPSFDSTYTRVVYADQGDLYEGTGSLTGTFQSSKISELTTANDAESSPSISPDGRVLVYFRQLGSNPTELMVARRANPTMSWETAIVIPGMVNSGYFEFDPMIASNGDLIFTSTRASGGVRRQLFLSRAQF